MATNHITDKNVLKSWFKRGLKPLEVQFHAWMDSYWHKEEKLPTSAVEGLESVLNQKAEKAAIEQVNQTLQEHTTDDQRHKTPQEQSKLDLLADNPAERYATKSELAELENNPDILVVTVDMSQSEDDIYTVMQTSFQGFYDKGVLFCKPVYLHYRFKKDYEAPDAEWFECLVKGEYDPANINRIIFSSPIKVEYKGGRVPAEYAYEIIVEVKDGIVDIPVWDYYKNPVDESMVFLLYEDGDGVIVMTDNETGDNFYPAYYSRWDELKEAMVSGNKRIAIMLKTQDSGVYCPASYNLKWNEAAGGFEGKISIQYLKEMDGVQYWCADDYTFGERNGYFKGNASGYGDYIEKDGERIHFIKRYPLNIQNNIIFTVDLTDMDPSLGLKSEAITDSLCEQGGEILDWSKPIHLFLSDSKGYRYEATLVSRKSITNNKGTIITVLFNTPRELQGTFGAALKLVINIQDQVFIMLTDTFADDRKIFHLREDGDGFITVYDDQAEGSWNSLDEEIKQGRHPIVYLETPDSEGECPVFYHFHQNEAGEYEGIMEIHYFKYTGGEWQLWLERKKFPNGCGTGSFYSDSVVALDGGGILKFLLQPAYG